MEKIASFNLEVNFVKTFEWREVTSFDLENFGSNYLTSAAISVQTQRQYLWHNSVGIKFLGLQLA